MAHLDDDQLCSCPTGNMHLGKCTAVKLSWPSAVINDWVKILNKRGQVDTFILDFEKAFDTPPHELLQSKLFGYGTGGKTLRWIDSFLSYRTQHAVVNGETSEGAPVLSGVPQRTILGPLLFSLYINDISTDIDSEIRLFADDCSLRETLGRVAGQLSDSLKNFAGQKKKLPDRKKKRGISTAKYYVHCY